MPIDTAGSSSRGPPKAVPPYMPPFESSEQEPNRSSTVSWEESFTIRDDAWYLFQQGTVVVFEVLQRRATSDCPGGIDRFAWGFLQPHVDHDGHPLLGLQRVALYQYQYKPAREKAANRVSSSVESGDKEREGPTVAFDYQLKENKKSVAGTIHIELSLEDPHKLNWLDRSTMTHAQIQKHEADGQETEQVKVKVDSMAKSFRKKDDWCAIPDSVNHHITTASDGCFRISISPVGDHLAAAINRRGAYEIRVYDLCSDCAHHCTLTAHHGLIYDISWAKLGDSPDSPLLLMSASQDSAVNVFEMPEKMTKLEVKPIQTLHHANFVYSVAPVQFDRPDQILVACSGNNFGIKIWRLTKVVQEGGHSWKSEGIDNFISDPDTAFCVRSFMPFGINHWTRRDD